MEEILDIYLLSNWSDEKKAKDSLEVVREQNECTSVLLIQGHEYIILGSIWPFLYTVRLRYPVLILTLAKNVHLYQES